MGSLDPAAPRAQPGQSYLRRVRTRTPDPSQGGEHGGYGRDRNGFPGEPQHGRRLGSRRGSIEYAAGCHRAACTDARGRHRRVRAHVLGVGPAVPAGRNPARTTGRDRVPAGVAGRRPGRRRVPRPHPGRRPHRPPRRSPHVPRRGAAHRPARALPGPLRGLADRLPDRRVLPRLGRHHVRDRHPVRQRLVSPCAARPGAGHLRRRHGRHRDLGVHHRAADQGHRSQLPVRPGRRGPRRLRRRRVPVAARPGRPARRARVHARQARGHVADGGDLAAVIPLRRRVRRVRRVQRVPAHLPHHRLPTRPRRRRPADRRFRGARRRHAPHRRLALRPAAPDRRACHRLRRRRGLRRPRRISAPADSGGHDRVPRDGRRAGDRHRCGVRPRRPHGRRRTSRCGHRCRRRRGRARWILPAPGHGPGLRFSRQLRPRIPAARRHRCHGRGIHGDDRATPRRSRGPAG